MRSVFFLIPLSLFLSVGCAAPPEVKQALIAKDQAYVENERLMQQYRELVSNVTERHQHWYRYVQTRLTLNLALQWATTNPRITDVPDAELAKDDADLLGPEVIAVINYIRLKNLPERKGSTGQTFFQAGTGDMNNLLQNLPELIGRIQHRIEKASQASSMKQYLDIDVTLSRNEVQSLAEAARTLRR